MSSRVQRFAFWPIMIPVVIGWGLVAWELFITGTVWIVEHTGPWFPAAIGGLCLSKHVQLDMQREADGELRQSLPIARLR